MMYQGLLIVVVSVIITTKSTLRAQISGKATDPARLLQLLPSHTGKSSWIQTDQITTKLVTICC